MATATNLLGGFSVPYFDYQEIFIGDYRSRLKRKIANAGLLMHKGKRRPLVFVLGGFGASIEEGSVRLLAYNLYKKMGYHVIVIPGQFWWYFALTTSKTIVLGDVSQDIKIYRSIMKKVLAKAQAMGLRFSNISIAGYSAGALRSLFLARQDKKDGFFNFKTVVAINPPMGIFQGGQSIDKFHFRWEKYTLKQKKILIARAYNFFFKLDEEKRKGTKHLLQYIYTNFPYTEEQIMSVIGYQFREKFSSYLGRVEMVNKTGLFNNTKELISISLGIFSNKFSFVEYFHKYLYPFYRTKQNRLSKKQLIHRASLHSLAKFLKTSSNVFIQHNQDDILLLNPKKDLRFLESLLKDRMIIYPTGGHLGNLWFPTNIKHFLSFFSDHK